ncbi:MAG: hypothetical protein K9N46_08780 [Candidatus Marinimicrobia bacterium]|nr:hypothetical protein [Candidatus Neomarinimicrobiota bacterium]MCF7830201.1 hypothetical protein [Candidatus Neomarinimicrobiota bacterium]MCF7880818.1 hypothetical protein [Candidatus Neomarinimicrobiota bacterium]
MNIRKFSKAVLAGCLALIVISGMLYGEDGPEKVELNFSIHQERDVYDRSDYGEPPQFAIWLENPQTGEVETVIVTHRTGTGEFAGKVECPVSLPVWIGVFRNETGRDDFPRPWKPFYESVTGATPKVENFNITVELESGQTWIYYIEMNVAGDYNLHFPAFSSDNRPDKHGNGQPSLIYKGTILTERGERSVPKVIGRTDQYYFTTEINSDLKNMKSAKQVFSDIVVQCE